LEEKSQLWYESMPSDFGNFSHDTCRRLSGNLKCPNLLDIHGSHFVHQNVEEAHWLKKEVEFNKYQIAINMSRSQAYSWDLFHSTCRLPDIYIIQKIILKNFEFLFYKFYTPGGWR
jgi:hypothetical protein